MTAAMDRLEQIRAAILTEAQKNEKFRADLLAQPALALKKRFNVDLPRRLFLKKINTLLR